MKMKRRFLLHKKEVHYSSGIVIAVFTCFHLINHLSSLKSPELHIAVTHHLRRIYRHPVVETLLMAAVIVQIITGWKLLRGRETSVTIFEKIRRYSSLYLVFFLMIHPAAIWVGRIILRLDTNFYFGALGFNQFPYYLFFLPYYLLAILAFSGHLAAVHYNRMKLYVSESAAKKQSFLIIVFGFVVWLLISYGFTGGFSGLDIPAEYHYLPE